MFVNFITNKRVFCIIGFLIVLSVVCVLWYQYDIAHFRKSLGTADTFLHQLEVTKKASEKDGVIEQPVDDVSVKNTMPTADIPMTEVTTEVENNVGTEQRQVSTITEKAVFTEVRMSPFGFGPYPEVPKDYLQKLGPPSWMREIPNGIDVPEQVLMNSELIGRVLVKLWIDGDTNIVGGSTDADGKVIPHYPNTIYVKITEKVNKDTGVIGRTFHMRGPPGTGQYHNHIIESRDVPSHITIVPWDNTVGIDPYTILNLEKE